MGKFKDLTGMKFGRLTVIKRTDKTKDGNYSWICECTCGNKTVVRDGNIKNGHTRSCGCLKNVGDYRINDLVGKRFGKLTVIRLSKKKGKGGKLYWHCKCDCGNDKEIMGSSLIQGKTTSCGCLKKEANILIGRKNIESGLIHGISKVGCFKGTKMQQLTQKLSNRNTSGIKGVSWSKSNQKWETYIGLAGKIIKLGYFDKLEDATKARKEAEEKYFKPVIEEYEKQKEGGISV